MFAERLDCLNSCFAIHILYKHFIVANGKMLMKQRDAETIKGIVLPKY